ncbi:hypothetical protein DL96DRAFT_1623399 [Flagelloscypha sp. PMI_526]|nr:hypothetical protein DL96DRAFT_1623399 [Flagelloscypha sp. PMI_526]
MSYTKLTFLLNPFLMSIFFLSRPSLTTTTLGPALLDPIFLFSILAWVRAHFTSVFAFLVLSRRKPSSSIL